MKGFGPTSCKRLWVYLTSNISTISGNRERFWSYSIQAALVYLTNIISTISGNHETFLTRFLQAALDLCDDAIPVTAAGWLGRSLLLIGPRRKLSATRAVF